MQKGRTTQNVKCTHTHILLNWNIAETAKPLAGHSHLESEPRKKYKTIMKKKTRKKQHPKITTQKNNGIYASSTLTVVKANVFYQMDLIHFHLLVLLCTLWQRVEHTHTKLNGELLSTTFPSLFCHPFCPNNNSHNSQMCVEDEEEEEEVCCCFVLLCFFPVRIHSFTQLLFNIIYIRRMNA